MGGVREEDGTEEGAMMDAHEKIGVHGGDLRKPASPAGVSMNGGHHRRTRHSGASQEGSSKVVHPNVAPRSRIIERPILLVEEARCDGDEARLVEEALGLLAGWLVQIVRMNGKRERRAA